LYQKTLDKVLEYKTFGFVTNSEKKRVVISKFNFTNFSQLVFTSFEKKNNKRTFVVLREPLLAKGIRQIFFILIK
ncbi:MAG TPA: hypothetical protein PLI77_07555, partial [Bacteroidales bacterium]|nr:hypothetical protein [Bacteroidales bacterium]